MDSWVRDLVLSGDYSSQAIEDTETYLNLLASRLSGRDDCKGVEYEVSIHDDNIEMIPEVYVYPKGCSRSSKLWKAHQYVANFNFDEPVDKLSHHLVPGKYRYILSSTKKKRRWMRDEN